MIGLNDFGETNSIILNPGHYDNEGGVIEFNSTSPNNAINGALIAGGTLRGNAPGTVVNISGAILHDVEIENIIFVGDYTFDRSVFTNEDNTPDTLSGAISFTGDTYFQRDSSLSVGTGFDFVFIQDFIPGGNPADRLIIEPGASVKLETFGLPDPPPDPIPTFSFTSLSNGGQIQSAQPIHLSSPVFRGARPRDRRRGRAILRSHHGFPRVAQRAG